MLESTIKFTKRVTVLLPQLEQRKNIPVYGLIRPDGKEIVLLYDYLDGFYGRFVVKGAEYQVVNLSASLELYKHKDGYKVMEEL